MLFKNPFSFNGRISRTEYIISFVIAFIASSGISELPSMYPTLPRIIFLVLSFPVLWFLIAQGTKRCHDIERSGFYQLIPFYFIVLMAMAAYEGSNEYGEDPNKIEEQK